MTVDDPQNWERFQNALETHSDGSDPIDIHLGRPPNLVMRIGGVKITFVNPDLGYDDPDRDFSEVIAKGEEEMTPEDLPIRPERMLIETPADDFEVLIDAR